MIELVLRKFSGLLSCFLIGWIITQNTVRSRFAGEARRAKAAYLNLGLDHGEEAEVGIDLDWEGASA